MMIFIDTIDRRAIFKFARYALKIPTGTESVENVFNQIKLNHTGKRGGLGKQKLRSLIYTIGSYLLLSKWW